jgi:hypothetical protein
MKTTIISQALPLDWPAVKRIETALHSSPSKTICLEINNSFYQLSIEGQWFKFSRLTKKRTIKRATIFETIAEIYNNAIHGNNWRIAQSPI